MPAARTVPDHAESPVRARQRAQVFHRAGDIADQPLVGHTARRTHGRGGVVGICAGGLS